MGRKRLHVTNAERQRAYRKRLQQNLKAYHRSLTIEWETPQALFATLHAEFCFTLDVCATAGNAKCPSFFPLKDDGLAQPWTGTCWMNPPYGPTIGAWMKKAYESAQQGATVVCLVPSRTDTKWWHEYAQHGEVRFLSGRLTFGNAQNPAPFPNALVVFRHNGAPAAAGG